MMEAVPGPGLRKYLPLPQAIRDGQAYSFFCVPFRRTHAPLGFTGLPLRDARAGEVSEQAAEEEAVLVQWQQLVESLAFDRVRRERCIGIESFLLRKHCGLS